MERYKSNNRINQHNSQYVFLEKRRSRQRLSLPKVDSFMQLTKKRKPQQLKGARVAVWFEIGEKKWFLGSVIEETGVEDEYIVKFDDGEIANIVLREGTHTIDTQEADRWILESEIIELPSLKCVCGNISQDLKGITICWIQPIRFYR